MALCPIGRSVYKVALDAPIVITDEGGKVAPEKVKCELKGRDDVQFRIDTCDVAFHQFGCVPKCRREEAITTQKIHSFMLREANCCETTTFFDGKNVCYSMDQDHLAKVAAPPLTATSFEHDLVKQRIAYAVIHTGTQYLSVHQGVLPGDHAGPRLFFNRGMKDPVENVIRFQLQHDPNAKNLQMTCQLFPFPVFHRTHHFC